MVDESIVLHRKQANPIFMMSMKPAMPNRSKAAMLLT